MKHKRIITIIFALAVLCGGAWAQQKQGHVMRPKPRGGGNTTVVGQAQLEVEYALNATDLRNPDTYIDLHVLQAGQRLSKHYSRFMEQGDSLYDAYMKANPHAEGVPTSLYTIGREGQYWSEYQSTEIFTEQGQQTLYAWMPWAMERYNAYYTEPAAQQKWTLHPSAPPYSATAANGPPATGGAATSRRGLPPTSPCASAHGRLADCPALS